MIQLAGKIVFLECNILVGFLFVKWNTFYVWVKHFFCINTFTNSIEVYVIISVAFT
jgi:hypothetical protein